MDKSPTQECRDTFEGAIGFWKSKRDAMDNLEGFLSGDRYATDNGAFNKDRRLVQIRGQETQDTIRHIVAKATEKPRSVEPRPIDQDDDPDAGEVVASLVERVLSDPYLGFEEEYEDAIFDSREKRLGIVWMDWEPDCGQFGEITFTRQDPRRIMWDPSFKSPHHPMCPWLMREKRLDVRTARKRYKAEWLNPDKDAVKASSENNGIPLIRGASGERLPNLTNYNDDKCTIWEFWWKVPPGGGKAEASEKDRDMPEEDRYLSCVSGCGYRSETQGEMGMELPEYVEQGCQTCGGDAERIDVLPENYAKGKGRYLTIMAPFSPSPEDKPLYYGDWPIQRARTFPGLFLTAYSKPGDPVGPCDVDYMWDQQIASDNLRTIAVQRVFEHRNYWKMPGAGINDYKGERFEFREDQFNVMYTDLTKAQMGPLSVELINGTGLDPAFGLAFNITQQALTQYRGMHDMGPIEERTKAKSGVALQTENAIGEVPVAHYNRRKNRALSMFYGVVSDYVLATLTPKKAARLNIDGVHLLAELSGDDLPNYDFVIEDTPDFTGLDKARSEAFQQLMQIALNPQTQPFLAVFAEINQFPRSTVRKVEQVLAEMKAEAERAAAMGMGGGMGGGLEGEMGLDPEMAAELEQMGGLNGAGMVPTPQQ